MSKADSPNTTSPSRRTVLAGISIAAAPVAVAVEKSVATIVPGNDPIFAVLAEHRAATRTYLRASEISGSLEDETPEWNAAWTETQAAVKREHAALYEVLTTAPTTLAGAVAVLDHVGQDNFLGEAGDEDYGESLLSCQVHGGGLLAEAAERFPARLAATMRRLTAAA
jgi:hypothetical protein